VHGEEKGRGRVGGDGKRKELYSQGSDLSSKNTESATPTKYHNQENRRHDAKSGTVKGKSLHKKEGLEEREKNTGGKR